MLSPFFFARLFIGGTAVESYEDFGGINLGALSYVAHLGVLFHYLLFQRRQVDTDGLMILIFVPLVLLSAIHGIILANGNEQGADIALVAIARGLLWMICCVAIVGAASSDGFLSVILQLTHVTFGIILVTVVIYFAIGLPLNMLIADGFPRAQGMMTEPSAVGCLLGGYVALAIAERRHKRLLLGLVCAVLVNSVIGILGVTIGIVSGTLVRWKSLNSIRPTVQFLIFMMFPLFIIVAPIVGSQIAEYSTELMRYFDGTDFGQTSFYQSIILRMLQAFSVLDLGLDGIANGDNAIEGGLFRFTSALLLVKEMTESASAFIGNGLGAHAQLMLAQNRTILDYGLLTFLLSSFGLVMGPLAFLFLVYNLCVSRSRLAVFAVPFSAIAMMNSAGGIHGYSIAIISALILFIERRRKKQNGV
jgi:hypothetical protein